MKWAFAYLGQKGDSHLEQLRLDQHLSFGIGASKKRMRKQAMFSFSCAGAESSFSDDFLVKLANFPHKQIQKGGERNALNYKVHEGTEREREGGGSVPQREEGRGGTHNGVRSDRRGSERPEGHAWQQKRVKGAGKRLQEGEMHYANHYTRREKPCIMYKP